jgi:hypothetical protein
MTLGKRFEGPSLTREGKTLCVKCITLRQNYEHREITTSDWKITIIPMIGLFIRQVFDITNIATLKTFPS